MVSIGLVISESHKAPLFHFCLPENLDNTIVNLLAGQLQSKIQII